MKLSFYKPLGAAALMGGAILAGTLLHQAVAPDKAPQTPHVGDAAAAPPVAPVAPPEADTGVPRAACAAMRDSLQALRDSVFAADGYNPAAMLRIDSLGFGRHPCEGHPR